MWSGSSCDAVGALGDALEQRALDLAAGACPWRARRGARCGRPRARGRARRRRRGRRGRRSSMRAADVLRAPRARSISTISLVAQAVADARACPRRGPRAVVGVEHGGDAALRVAGVRLVGGALGGDEHAAVLGRAQREVQPGEPGAEDQVVRFQHARNLAPARAAVPARYRDVCYDRRVSCTCDAPHHLLPGASLAVAASRAAARSRRWGWCRCLRRRTPRCARATAPTAPSSSPTKRGSSAGGGTFWSRERSDGVVEFTNLPPVGSRWKVWLRTGPGKAAALRGTNRQSCRRRTRRRRVSRATTSTFRTSSRSSAFPSP